MDADVIVVGAGLAGLVATCELVERGRRVLVVDQENSANIGGQAFWSFGGLFFVDSPEQRRMGIHDSHELALQDWLGTAAFDRPEDHWPQQWAHAYVDFASGEKRTWLKERGLKIFPLVGWAERGDTTPAGTGTRCRDSTSRGVRDRRWSTSSHGGSGALPGAVRAPPSGRRTDRRRWGDHRGAGTVLEPSSAARGVASSRKAVGEFEFRASAVIVTSGGIGATRNWCGRIGRRGWGVFPSRCWPGCRPTSTGG